MLISTLTGSITVILTISTAVFPYSSVLENITSYTPAIDESTVPVMSQVVSPVLVWVATHPLKSTVSFNKYWFTISVNVRV